MRLLQRRRREHARCCGIKYARTTVSTGNFAVSHDRLRLPATCHHDDPRLFELADKFLPYVARVRFGTARRICSTYGATATNSRTKTTGIGSKNSPTSFAENRTCGTQPTAKSSITSKRLNGSNGLSTARRYSTRRQPTYFCTSTAATFSSPPAKRGKNRINTNRKTRRSWLNVAFLRIRM